MFMIYLQNIKIKMSLRNNLLTSFKFFLIVKEEIGCPQDLVSFFNDQNVINL